MKAGTRKRLLEEEKESLDLPLAKRFKQLETIAWKVIDFFNPFKTSPFLSLSFVEKKDLLKEVQWAHGSTSATLALMKLTGEQLIPYGKLPPCVVPFVGELSEGITFGGVNQEGISGVSAHALSYAWGYATRGKKGETITTDKLKSNLLKSLDYLLNDPNVIPREEKVERALIHLQRMTLWDVETLQSLLKEKRFFSLLQRAKGRVEKSLDEITHRIKQLEKLFSLQEWENLQQAVENKLNYPPDRASLEAINEVFRKLRLFLPIKEKRERLYRVAQDFAAFGGWKSDGIAATFMSEEWYFQASVMAYAYCALKYEEAYHITHARTYLKEVLIPRFQRKKQKCEAIFASLGKSFHCLDEGQKAFIQKNIPLLFCSTQKHHEAREERRDGCLWKKALTLGVEIDVLVTDTADHKQSIEHCLKQRAIENVRVGLWRPKK